jgi:hypothetical protein
MKEKIEKLTRTLLEIWLSTESGEGLFRFTGGYWEVLYPILQKYQPRLLKQYESLLGEEFSFFNEEVREKLTTNDELQDLENAINYYNERIGVATADTTHTIELDGDKTIEYMPNQNLDYSQEFD